MHVHTFRMKINANTLPRINHAVGSFYSHVYRRFTQMVHRPVHTYAQTLTLLLCLAASVTTPFLNFYLLKLRPWHVVTNVTFFQ